MIKADNVTKKNWQLENPRNIQSCIRKKMKSEPVQMIFYKENSQS